MRLVPLVATAAALAAAAPAAAAAPRPFGHPCSASAGARVCPTASDGARVPSFDGVPLDVDVWLPPRGDGPFPTIAILHGFGGSKRDGESAAASPTYNAAYFARNGYAVVVPSSRGFGRSCGVPDSRTAGCERGWLHLSDQRYEGRDVQGLLGTLVDEGVSRAGALAVTGQSYGGGLSLTLATLADRVRRPDGSFGRWRSPAGRPLRIAAAYARIPWSDLTDSLVPNGRLLAPGAPFDDYADPIGVPIDQYLNGLFTVATTSGFVAPEGADPSADLRAWRARVNQGEPYGARVRRIQGLLHRFHGALGVPLTRPAPLLIQSGWTDDLFPIGQGLRMYETVRREAPGSYVSLQLGDLGHDRGGRHRLDARAMELGGLRFFDAFLKRGGSSAAPRSGSVVAFGQSCPRDAPRGSGPWRAPAYGALAHGSLSMVARGDRQRVTSTGGDPALSAEIAPIGLDACRGFPVRRLGGTAVATLRSPGATLLGRPTVRLSARVFGRFAQLVARLWDVANGRQRLIDRGVYRLAGSGPVAFRLNGNAWRFARGHTIKLELVGRDGPTYRPSNGRFSVSVRGLRVALPTREAVDVVRTAPLSRVSGR